MVSFNTESLVFNTTPFWTNTVLVVVIKMPHSGNPRENWSASSEADDCAQRLQNVATKNHTFNMSTRGTTDDVDANAFPGMPFRWHSR